MSNHVVVRAARAEDKESIVAFCQNTFSWGDYIADAWDRWLTDSSGQMLVGLVDDRPAAVVHVKFLDEGVAWLEGMRVHPDQRKIGIGAVMDTRALELARDHGCCVARLVTSIKNLAAQGLFAKQGYARLAQFNEWQTSPARKKFSQVRVGNSDAVAVVQSMWNEADARATCELMPNRHWHWFPLDELRVRHRIQSGEVRLVDDGFAMLLAFDEKDWNGLSLYALCGKENAMRELAIAARGEAHYRGYQHVEANLIDHPGINAALADAGYSREGGVLVYEFKLK